MKQLIHSTKQAGSFAVEAAFVMLTLICFGLAFYLYGVHIMGNPGTCTVAPSVETAANTSTSVTVVNGYGLLGKLNAAVCKSNVPSPEEWTFIYDAPDSPI